MTSLRGLRLFAPNAFWTKETRRRLSVAAAKRPLTDEESAAKSFGEWLQAKANQPVAPAQTPIRVNNVTKEDWRILATSALATFALHVHARVNALEGKAFYTIGPCGEEFAGVWGI